MIQDDTPHGFCSSYRSTTYIRFVGDKVNKAYQAYFSQTVLDSDTGFDGGISTAMLILYVALLSVEQPQSPPPLKFMLHGGKVVPWASLQDIQRQRRNRSSSIYSEFSTGGAVALPPTTSTAGLVSRAGERRQPCGELTVGLGGTELTILEDAVGRGINGVISAGR